MQSHFGGGGSIWRASGVDILGTDEDRRRCSVDVGACCTASLADSALREKELEMANFFFSNLNRSFALAIPAASVFCPGTSARYRSSGPLPLSIEVVAGWEMVVVVCEWSVVWEVRCKAVLVGAGVSGELPEWTY